MRQMEFIRPIAPMHKYAETMGRVFNYYRQNRNNEPITEQLNTLLRKIRTNDSEQVAVVLHDMGAKMIDMILYVEDPKVEELQAEVANRLDKALDKNGTGLCISVHEIYGLIAEEVDEWDEALSKGDIQAAQNEEFDILIGIIWGIVSIDNFDIIESWRKKD